MKDIYKITVTPNSRAENAGLRSGDILCSLNGVVSYNIENLQDYFTKNNQIRIMVKRGNKALTYQLYREHQKDPFGVTITRSSESNTTHLLMTILSNLLLLKQGRYILVGVVAFISFLFLLSNSSDNPTPKTTVNSNTKNTDPYIPEGSLFCLSKSAFDQQISMLSSGTTQYADKCFSSGANIPITIDDRSFTGANKVTLLTNGKTWFVPYEAIHYGYKDTAKFKKDASILAKVGLANNQKAEICKSYIGSIFGRSPNIIEHYDTDDQGFVYVKYARKSDNSLWRYRCNFSPDNRQVIWSGFILPDQVWGRWRDEDTVTITYDDSKKLATFDIPLSTDKLTLKI